MRAKACLPLLPGLLLLAACGGGGGGGESPLPPIYVYDAPFDEALSGTVVNDTPTGEHVDHTIFAAGDLTANTTRRAFYTVTTDGLPPGARVQSAILRVRQYLVVGEPFAQLGDVVVDHVDAGSTLDRTDYSRVQHALDIGTISTDAELGWREVDVTQAIRADVAAGRPTTTLRLRHRAQTNVDGNRDFTGFSPVQWTEDNRRPTLLVAYTRP